MKNTLRILSVLMVLVFALTTFTGCLDIDFSELFPTTTENGNNEDPPVLDGSYKVYWMQGQKELRVDTVKAGETVSPWTPNVEGKTFVGWFSNPGCTTEFDFTQPITKETEIYASFKTSSGQLPDEPEYADYYLIGMGAGDLSVSNWDHNNSAANLGLEDIGNGLYTITIDMYAGDKFQICHGLSWDGQMGIGYIPGAEHLPEDELNAQVKDADGNVVFTGASEYGNSFENWNITLAEGRDGVYKFTLDIVAGTITWEFVKALDPKDDVGGTDAEHDIRFVGTFNEWSTTYVEGELALTESADGLTWTGTMTITEDMYQDWTIEEGGFLSAALKLYDVATGTWIGYNGNNNLFLTAGTYEFTYYVETNSFTYNLQGEAPVVPEVPDSEIHFVGTFNNWSDSTGEWALTEGEDGKTWTGTLVITEDMYGDWTEAEMGFNCAALKLLDVANNKWIGYNGDNNLGLTVGTYHFKYVEGEATFTYWKDGEDEPSDEPSTPSEKADVVYLVPGSWAEDGSMYAAWCWKTGGDGAWYDVTDSDGDGIYECVVPEDCDMIIFVDFNAGTTTPDWGSKRVQTGDMKVPTNGNVYYNADTDTWTSK